MALDSTASLSTILNTLEESTLINVKPQMVSVINNLATENDLPIKTKIVNTVGAPSVNTDTWDNINTDIQTSKDALVTNLGTLGITAVGTDTLNNLVNKVVKDADLVTGNIRSGVNIFGVIGKSSVVDTADATASAGYILSGFNAYVNGSKISGSMPNDPVSPTDGRTLSGTTQTPSTTSFIIPPGRYGAGLTILGDANLVAGNILSGKTIFGVAGSATMADLQAGDNIALLSSSLVESPDNATPTKIKEIKVLNKGTVRVKYEALGTNYANPCYIQLYKNGTAIGTLNNCKNLDMYDTTFKIYTQDVAVNANDLLQIYAYGVYVGGGYPYYTHSKCQNFGIYVASPIAVSTM